MKSGVCNATQLATGVKRSQQQPSGKGAQATSVRGRTGAGAEAVAGAARTARAAAVAGTRQEARPRVRKAPSPPSSQAALRHGTLVSIINFLSLALTRGAAILIFIEYFIVAGEEHPED